MAARDQAHCNLGVLLRERGQLEEAVAAYEAALAAAPNFATVRNNLAIALTDLGGVGRHGVGEGCMSRRNMHACNASCACNV